MARAAKQEEVSRPISDRPAGPMAVRPFESLTSAEQQDARRQLQLRLQSMRDKDRELIRGRFRYYECPGGVMKFAFKQYKGDPVQKYSLQDGDVVRLPLGVIRHLNKNCYYAVHEYAHDKNGNPMQRLGKKIQRCEFIPMEFVDIEDLSPSGSDLITVEGLLQ
jgi:hypothetical protein